MGIASTAEPGRNLRGTKRISCFRFLGATLLPQIEANGMMHLAGFFPSVLLEEWSARFGLPNL
jgi:hypothetical protein